MSIFAGRSQPSVQDLLTTFAKTLAADSGTAGILRDQAPPPLDQWPGVDAIVVGLNIPFFRMFMLRRNCRTLAEAFRKC